MDKNPFRHTPLTEPIDGGFILARSDAFVIDVTLMAYNWRLHVALPELYGKLYERGYCYFGVSSDSLMRACLAGWNWDDPFRTDPDGFDKRAF